jgi:hypothetical protein
LVENRDPLNQGIVEVFAAASENRSSKRRAYMERKIAMRLRSRVYCAVGSGVAAFASGFGAMSLFWIHSRREHEQLTGLYEYLAASWGDGLCLPVGIATLSYLTTGLPRTPGETKLSIGCGVSAALIGAAVQAGWLLDDNPALNWTLPAPHHFNAAGVYHAVFLTALAGYNGVLAGLASARLRSCSDSLSVDGAVALIVAVIAYGSFLVMLIIDNRNTITTKASIATFIGLIAALIALVVIIERRNQTP